MTTLLPSARRWSAGDTDQQALDYLVARYGDFVLLKPPLDRETAVLWAMPVLVLGAGGVGGLAGPPVGREAPGVAAPLSGDEQARVDELVG